MEDIKKYTGDKFTGLHKLERAEYWNCEFEKCVVLFDQVIPKKLIGCSFTESTFAFSEESAKTLGYLSALYRSGEPEFRMIIEQIFDGIRHGYVPVYVNKDANHDE